MKPVIYAALTVGWLSQAVAARAQASQQAQTMCYQVEIPAPNVLPYGPILLDRCTGLSWVLIRTNLNSPNEFTYRWRLIIVDSSEATLSIPALPTFNAPLPPFKPKQ